MTDDKTSLSSNDKLVKLIKHAVKDEIKPLHGEMAIVTREVRDLKMDSFRTSSEVRKNTRELARIDSSLENLTEGVKKLSEN